MDKTTILMILDGYGVNEKTEGNAVKLANKPNLDRIMSEYPCVKGYASGLAVGLPDGQMGNSEVGHLNMGAGRIVYQELTKITKAIEDGDFFTMVVFILILLIFLHFLNLQRIMDLLMYIFTHSSMVEILLLLQQRASLLR